MSRTPEHKAWQNMLARCHCETCPNFRLYGARGITVCARWRESFEAFLADVGARPSPAHSIDRIDNAKGYEPGNVRWATRLEQARNKRTNRWITVNGERVIATEYAERFGVVSRLQFFSRIRRGMDPLKAATMPIDTKRSECRKRTPAEPRRAA
jgi:hypothetical protein